MLKEYIDRYLRNTRRVDPVILADTGRRMMKCTHRQLMEQTTARSGGSYPPSAATKCVRANYGAWIGAPADPLDPSSTNKFLAGDLAEAVALCEIRLAIAETKHSIGLNNDRIDVALGSHGEHRTGYIDGMLNFNHDGHEALGFDPCRPPKQDWVGKGGDENLLVEIKSMDDYPFQQFMKNGPDDTWGYLGQITVYQRTLELRRYLYLAVHRASYEIAEFVGTYDGKYATLADANYDTVMAGARTATPPSIPIGNSYGADATDGRLRLLCRFCSRKKWCWGLEGYEIEDKVERGFMGKPTIAHFVRPVGASAGHPTAAPGGQLFDALAIASEIISDATAKATAPKPTTKTAKAVTRKKGAA
jgi:hypothetical protein